MTTELFNVLRRVISAIARSRVLILSVFFIILFVILVRRLFELQIVEGSRYLDTFTYRIRKEVQIDAPRGAIYDANGTALAYDRQTYAITIEDSTLLVDNDTRNAMIENLIRIVEAHGKETVNNMPFVITEEGEVVFSGSDGTIRNFKKDVFGLNYTDILSDARDAMTGQELFDYLRGESFFNIDPSLSTEETMKIMALRYELFMKRYQKYVSVTAVTDVDDVLAAVIKENSDILPGVNIAMMYIREYTDSQYFAHITGYTGKITDSELARFAEEGHDEYNAADIVGKTGLEATYEYELSGTRGSQTLYVNSLGSVLDITDVQEVVPGHDIYLTIDGELTKKIYDLLEEKIAGIILSKLVDSLDERYNSKHFISYAMVFQALIDNGVIDIEHLYEYDANSHEKSVGRRMNVYIDNLMEKLDRQMKVYTITPGKDLDESFVKYYNYMYTWLTKTGLLDTGKYTTEQADYAAFESGETGLGDFLKTAIQQGWVNIEQLHLTDAYSDTAQVYEVLVDTLIAGVRDDVAFRKICYRYAIADGAISEQDICQLLYDQGILDKTDNDYSMLLTGRVGPRAFIFSKMYYMEITPDMLALDTCAGACVLTDPKTGKVKAVVSYPSYDASRINDPDYFSYIVNNGSSPMFNRATYQTSAPGSTYKPLCAICGLQEELITLDTYVLDRVVFEKVVPSPSCWLSTGHGSVNVISAIGQSCNYFFYNLGYNASITSDGRMLDSKGLAILQKYAELFGFGQTTGIEIGEAQPRISDESAVRSFIGQGTNNYTPTQVNRYTAALANRGTVYNLSVVDRITDGNSDHIVETVAPSVLNELSQVPEETWDAVHIGMRQVVQSTSYRQVFTSLPMSVAGKSGTAQESELKPDHAWFTGFAPYDNPKIAVTVLISCGYGSTNVVDTFRDAIAIYFGLNTYQDYKEGVDSPRHAQFPINYFPDEDNENRDDGHD